MRRASFPTLLVGINVGLLLLAVVGVALAAVRALDRLAGEQALARAGAAGAGALAAIERSARDASTSAHLLAERPTLERLLREGDRPALASFLDRFRQTGGLDGAVVLLDGRRVAASGVSLPWEALAAAVGERRESAVVRVAGGRLVLAAEAPVPGGTGGGVMVGILLDAGFARQIGDQLGLPVAILGREEVEALSAGPRAELLSQALDGDPVRGRLGDAYLAAQPLRNPSGEVLGVIAASLPARGVASSVESFIRRLLRVVVAVAALALLASLAAGRSLGRPVAALTAAAARVGRGDLSTPVPAAPGAELGTLAATMEDMRRRLLRLTAELSQREKQGEAILAGIAEGVMTIDRDRRIRYLNPQAAALLGVAPEAAIGRFCGDVLRPEGPAGGRPCEDSCPIVHARSRGTTRATEHLLRPDGRRRSVVITSSPPAGEQQVLVLRDETEVEATRRLRDAVLANISHEFKTPLAAQLASIELLRDRLADLPDASARQLVLALERGTLRLTQLIDNLLESVRIESGQDSIRRAPVHLDEVVEAAVEMTEPLLAQRGQRLAVELPYPLPALSGDAPRLTQVLVNLLANANKFAPAGSTISIGGAVRNGSVALWVEDEGPGLPETEDRSLFGRFVRSPGEEPEQGGMGLGLAIVESIVARHGGRVEAESAGQGARLLVVLPLEKGA